MTSDRPGLLVRGVLAVAGVVVVACASAEPDYSVQAPGAGHAGAQASGASGSAGSSTAGKGGSASGQGGVSAGQGGAAAGKGGEASSGASGAGVAGSSAGKAGSGSSGASGQQDAFGGTGGTGNQAGTSSQGGTAAGTSSAGGKGGTSSQGGAAGTGVTAGQGGTSSGGSGPVVEPPAGALVIGEQVETTTQKIVTQDPEPILRVVASGTTPCKLSGSPFFTKTAYAYAQIFNPNAQPAQVELGVGAITGQTPPNMPIVAAYATFPETDADRSACVTGAEISCTENKSLLSCLSGKQAPTIPAHGSVWLYVGNFDADDPAVSFVLYARVLKFL